jgi:hypothetical protein
MTQTPRVDSTPSATPPFVSVHSSPFAGGQPASVLQPQPPISQNHGNATLSQIKPRLLVQCYNRQVLDFAAYHGISPGQIPLQALNELKRKAEFMAGRIIARKGNGRSLGTSRQKQNQQLRQHQQLGSQKMLAASPLPKHPPPVADCSVPGRSSQTHLLASPFHPRNTTFADHPAPGRPSQTPSAASPHVVATRRTSMDGQNDGEELPHGKAPASNPHGDGRPKTLSQQENLGEAIARTNQALTRHQLLTNQLAAAIREINKLYTTRKVFYQQFLIQYPVRQHQVVAAAFNLVANHTSLDKLAEYVYKLPDPTLLQVVQEVSEKLRDNLPGLQQWTAPYLQAILDPQFKWTAMSKACTTFYDSFSSLKAALRQRDRRRGDSRATFIDALNYDRAQVLEFLKPESDDELDAALAEESFGWTVLRDKEAQKAQQLQVQQLHQAQQVQQELDFLQTRQHAADGTAKEEGFDAQWNMAA